MVQLLAACYAGVATGVHGPAFLASKTRLCFPACFFPPVIFFLPYAVVIIAHVHTFDLLILPCGLRLRRQEFIQCLISASHLKI